MVFCAVCAIAWVLSHLLPTSVWLTRRVVVVSTCGGFGCFQRRTAHSHTEFMDVDVGPVPLSWLPAIRPSGPVRGILSFKLFIPYWVFLVAAGGPTAYLWHRDRRYPRGHCQACGHDLTGNTSGVCPECAEPI
jgi:hypothetical protein